MRKLPADVAALMRRKLEQVSQDPFALHPNVTKLQNRDGYRLRVGDWRAIYIIRKEELIILGIKLASRGEVYK